MPSRSVPDQAADLAVHSAGAMVVLMAAKLFCQNKENCGAKPLNFSDAGLRDHMPLVGLVSARINYGLLHMDKVAC